MFLIWDTHQVLIKLSVLLGSRTLSLGSFCWRRMLLVIISLALDFEVNFSAVLWCFCLCFLLSHSVIYKALQKWLLLIKITCQFRRRCFRWLFLFDGIIFLHKPLLLNLIFQRFLVLNFNLINFQIVWTFSITQCIFTNIISKLTGVLRHSF